MQKRDTLWNTIMEPIEKPRVATFKGLRMYRPDLDLLVGKFQSRCQRVSITDDDMSYGSLEEMLQHRGPEVGSSFEIVGSEPSVSFRVSKQAYTLFGAMSVPTQSNVLRMRHPGEDELVYYSLKEFLESKEKGVVVQRTTAVLLWLFSFAVPTRAFSKTFSHITVLDRLLNDHPTFAGGFSVALWIASLYATLWLVRTKNTIYLTKKDETQSFFERHQDKIWDLIKIGLGGIVGYLVGLSRK